MQQNKWRMIDFCDMQIYMSLSWNVNTWAKPLCLAQVLTFQLWDIYILACHTRHHASFVYCDTQYGSSNNVIDDTV